MYRAMGVHPLFARALALFALLAAACAAEPIVKLNRFQNMPARLFSFGDNSTLAYHDRKQGTVYLSQDEGSSWAPANDLPRGEIGLVIPHPANDRMAFALTYGTKHWRTEDSGISWRSFDVPHEPSFSASPLAFHSDKAKDGHILYQGFACETARDGWGNACRDETYYVKEAFLDKPKKLLSDTQQCMFAHSSDTFVHKAHPDLVYCIAYETSEHSGAHSTSTSRFYSSTDFFETEGRVEELGIGTHARGAVALSIVNNFVVVALENSTHGRSADPLFYVSVDAENWARTSLPHARVGRLREDAYFPSWMDAWGTRSTGFGFDVILDNHRALGTLVSDNMGTRFVESLAHANRNDLGLTDFEQVYGVTDVGIVNVVANAPDVEAHQAPKRLASRITFNDGRSWGPLRAPATDVEGMPIGCDISDVDTCSLHLHFVPVQHHLGRGFSGSAPGLVIGVGSVGAALRPYAECDTFLSSDAGKTWIMVRRDAHIHAFGDQGNIIVAAKDEGGRVSTVHYSFDLGKTWQELQLGFTIRVHALVTNPHAAVQKLLLLGHLASEDKDQNGGYAGVLLDFATVRSRQCGTGDFYKSYAREEKGKECIMGHKQWSWRRKADADCYLGKQFEDTKEHEENCSCDDDDYECDFNFALNGGTCVSLGPETIRADACTTGAADETYLGSSGYRLIAGNTCDGTKGSRKDEPIHKPCPQVVAPEGEIRHQAFKFSAAIVQKQYFESIHTLPVLLQDHIAWPYSMWLFILAGLFAAAAGVATWIRRARRTAIRLSTSEDGGALMFW